MNPIRALVLLTLLSSKTFAYSWVAAPETENPCMNSEQRANFKAAYYCQRFDSGFPAWEPWWVCLTVPREEGGVKNVTLYTQTTKYFYEDTLNLKFTLPVKNSSKTLTGSLSGSAKDRQSSWDKVKISLDKQTGILRYVDSSALPAAPEISRPYEFNFQCTAASPRNTPVLGRIENIAID